MVPHDLSPETGRLNGLAAFRDVLSVIHDPGPYSRVPIGHLPQHRQVDLAMQAADWPTDFEGLHFASYKSNGRPFSWRGPVYQLDGSDPYAWREIQTWLDPLIDPAYRVLVREKVHAEDEPHLSAAGNYVARHSATRKLLTFCIQGPPEGSPGADELSLDILYGDRRRVVLRELAAAAGAYSPLLEAA